MSECADIQGVLRRLGGSSFRRKFALGEAERRAMRRYGVEGIRQHARRFVIERLTAAQPARDGRQTPWRGHPVFVAQHATATCCRGCLAKWHAIEPGRALDAAQIDYIVAVLDAWLARQGVEASKTADSPCLFDD